MSWDFSSDQVPSQFAKYHYQKQRVWTDPKLAPAVYADNELDECEREANMSGYRGYVVFVIRFTTTTLIKRKIPGAPKPPPPLKPPPPGVTMRGLMRQYGSGRGRAIYYGMRGMDPKHIAQAMGHKGGVKGYNAAAAAPEYEYIRSTESYYRILWDDSSHPTPRSK